MSIVRISLLKRNPLFFLKALSDGVHRAMVKTIDVPPTDRFHVIHQHERERSAAALHRRSRSRR